MSMLIKSFYELIELIREDISSSETHVMCFRACMSPEEKVVVTYVWRGARNATERWEEAP